MGGVPCIPDDCWQLFSGAVAPEWAAMWGSNTACGVQSTMPYTTMMPLRPDAHVFWTRFVESGRTTVQPAQHFDSSGEW